MEVRMDNITLKKKLSSYVSQGGYLKNVSDELLYEILIAWENWTASGSEFYKSLGFSQRQMASVIGKAKKLKRQGHFGEGEFKQIKLESTTMVLPASGPCAPVEVVWPDGKLIRFAQVDHLIEFLKKVA